MPYKINLERKKNVNIFKDYFFIQNKNGYV